MESKIRVIFGPAGDFGLLKALHKKIPLESCTTSLDIEFNLLYNDNPEIIINNKEYRIPFLSEFEIEDLVERLLRGEEIQDNYLQELPIINREYPPSQGVATAF
ncbi:hypothetical protein [Sulfuracidifex metallicus]|jgi:hypothetical protein|uniref:Uncharacterized protein n=1 Tax=Sulfuracidifex metallicus DSM 6482 = JCM 9184 TaxID=523847 RepID=A0A6A9QKC1_SULME|nr:hypothetical protein [Sulfuracidifex metallicus]MUN28720.1 hypothetical protein [Sulfuracidifex metallicus DSM 6482 = JCM 9184]WOE50759.1 hypothetical protein RQ359_002328 [Sulfuracidifex metallicus DSM 6482 = JCM 9184]